VAAIALNTRLLNENAARAAIADAAAHTGLPADDPVRFGPDKLLDAVLHVIASKEPGSSTRPHRGRPKGPAELSR
jgi:hypothetical protein